VWSPGQGKKLIEAARLLARGELTLHSDADDPPSDLDDALAAFGLVLDDDPDDPRFHLWGENREALHTWLGVQTQWRVGMGGPTGLDYAGVEAYLRMRAVRAPARRARLLLELQVMERATLEEWQRMQAERDRRPRR
jgi:hypothetical protein